MPQTWNMLKTGQIDYIVAYCAIIVQDDRVAMNGKLGIQAWGSMAPKLVLTIQFDYILLLQRSLTILSPEVLS